MCGLLEVFCIGRKWLGFRVFILMSFWMWLLGKSVFFSEVVNIDVGDNWSYLLISFFLNGRLGGVFLCLF